MRQGYRSAAGFILALLVPVAEAAESREGSLGGFVQDAAGIPMRGVLVSVLGRGRLALVTRTDSAGRFFLSSLPAGPYTLHAAETDHVASHEVTVKPNRAEDVTLSLTDADAVASAPAGSATQGTPPASSSEAERVRELRWLLRHKRRSVLEARGPGWSPPNRGQAAAVSTAETPGDRSAAWLAGLEGTVEVMPGAQQRSGLGLLRLEGRLRDAHWRIGGVVREDDPAGWRMTSELVLEPLKGHRIEAGTSCGVRPLWSAGGGDGDKRLDGPAVGTLFIRDRWEMPGPLIASIGARYSYLGFLQDRHYVDPLASIELEPGGHTRIRGSAGRHTQVPGGDLLTFTLLAPDTATFAAVVGDPQAGRALRYEISFDRTFGTTTAGGVRVFYVDLQNPLVNVFGASPSLREDKPASPDLRIFNGRSLAARGVGAMVSHRFGGWLSGTMSYSYGRGARQAEPARVEAAQAGLNRGLPLVPEGSFHDVAARIETVFRSSDTRVTLFSRVVAHPAEARLRFELQVRQGLPFLARQTGTDWEVLVSVRNLFYEGASGEALEELFVLNPPHQILGGVSARF